MPSPDPELSSLSTALSELTRRIAALAEGAAAAHRDDLASELFAIERSLTAAGRRLGRLTSSTRPPMR